MHLINIVNVEYSEAYKLNLKFSNGEWRTIDLEPELLGPVFGPLKDDITLFKQVKVDYGTIIWPGDIDLAPEFLYEKSQPLDRAAA
jgi:hypothetical protein